VNIERRTRALSEVAESGVPDSVDLWPSIRSRARKMSMIPPAGGVGRGRRLAVGLLAAVFLALLAAGALWSSQPAPVSAEAILERAQAAGTQTARSYHLVAESRSGGKALATGYREAWFDGNRARQTFRLLDAGGAQKAVIDIIFDGTQSWSVVTSDGQTTAVHATGGDLKARAEGLGQQDSLASFLALYNNDKSCMAARISGDGVVAGRTVYEITVEPSPDRCASEPASVPADGGKQPPAADQQSADQKATGDKAQKALKKMVLWIDKETYLPLKTTMYALSGEVLDESETSSIQYDVAIPDSTFTYTPPAGVTVLEAGQKGAASR
jgi:MucB/RseB family protein